MTDKVDADALDAPPGWHVVERRGRHTHVDRVTAEKDILAIEAEARAAALDDAVTVLRREDLCDATDGEHHTDEYVAAFLAAIDALRERA